MGLVLIFHPSISFLRLYDELSKQWGGEKTQKILGQSVELCESWNPKPYYEVCSPTLLLR